MELIDKDALVAEIKRRIKCITKEYQEIQQPEFFLLGKINGLENILPFLDTVEVKEMDLEKELESWRHNHFHGRRDKEASGEYLERTTQLDIAKHFFELGMQQSKNYNNNEE